MAVFRVPTPILTAIRYLGYLFGIAVFSSWVFLLIFSTSTYLFIGDLNTAQNCTCYQNLTAQQLQTTLRYRFDFWIIWLEVVFGIITVIIFVWLMAEVRQTAFYFIHAVLGLACAIFFIGKTVYYYIAFLSCNSFWFCSVSCIYDPRVPTWAFIISFLEGIGFLFYVVVQLLLNPVIHGLTRSAVKREVLLKGFRGQVEVEANINQLDHVSKMQRIDKKMYYHAPVLHYIENYVHKIKWKFDYEKVKKKLLSEHRDKDRLLVSDNGEDSDEYVNSDEYE